MALSTGRVTQCFPMNLIIVSNEPYAFESNGLLRVWLLLIASGPLLIGTVGFRALSDSQGNNLSMVEYGEYKPAKCSSNRQPWFVVSVDKSKSQPFDPCPPFLSTSDRPSVHTCCALSEFRLLGSRLLDRSKV